MTQLRINSTIAKTNPHQQVGYGYIFVKTLWFIPGACLMLNGITLITVDKFMTIYKLTIYFLSKYNPNRCSFNSLIQLVF